MYLINNLEFSKENNEWKHVSTRVISTCFNRKEALEKLRKLEEINTVEYKTINVLQKI